MPSLNVTFPHSVLTVYTIVYSHANCFIMPFIQSGSMNSDVEPLSDVSDSDSDSSMTSTFLLVLVLRSPVCVKF